MQAPIKEPEDIIDAEVFAKEEPVNNGLAQQQDIDVEVFIPNIQIMPDEIPVDALWTKSRMNMSRWRRPRQWWKALSS